MKLYEYRLISNLKCGGDFSPYIEKTEYEVEEKPKTYVFQDCHFPQRVAKDNLGYLDEDRVLLAEDNFSLAKEILMRSTNRKITYLKWKIENATKELEKAQLVLEDVGKLESCKEPDTEELEEEYE